MCANSFGNVVFYFLFYTHKSKAASEILKIRGNRMSYNALFSNFTVPVYLGIFSFSLICSGL